ETQVRLHADARRVIRNADNGHFPDRLMAVKTRLNLTQFHTVSAALDHSITTPDVTKIAVLLLHHDVACPVPSPRIVRAGEKRGCRRFGQLPVTLHHVRARDAQLAFRAPWDHAPSGIHDQ